MADVDVRIVELIDAKSVFEVGGGRPGLFGYENEAATLRMQIGASPTANIMYVARRDAAQTFQGTQTFAGQVVGTSGSTTSGSFSHQVSGAHDALRFVLTSRASSDSSSRFVIREGGTLEWGGGGGRDTNLYRDSASVLKTDDTFEALNLRTLNGTVRTERASSSNDAYVVGVTGEAVNRFVIRSDGRMFWGNGTDARDVTLYRSTADVLKTDDSFDAASLSIGGVQRISSGGAGTFTDLTDSGLTATHVVFAGTGGNLTGHAALTMAITGGHILTIGTGASSTTRLDIDGGAGTTVAIRLRQAGVLRWAPLIDGSTTRFQIVSYDSSGVEIDRPLEIQASGTGRIFLNRSVDISGILNVVNNIQTSGVTRISSGGAGTLTTLITTGLATLAQATVSDIAADQVVSTTTAGRLMGDAGLAVTRVSGITRLLAIGNYATANDVFFTARQTASQLAGLALNDSAQNRRWTVAIAGTDWRLGRWTDSSTKVDDAIIVVAGSAGLITIGGSSNSPTNFTGAIQTSGVQRISSGGAASFTTLGTTGTATIGGDISLVGNLVGEGIVAEGEYRYQKMFAFSGNQNAVSTYGLYRYTGTGGHAFTLAGSSYYTYILHHAGTGVLTVNVMSSGIINGVTSITLQPGQVAYITGDGVAYRACIGGYTAQVGSISYATLFTGRRTVTGLTNGVAGTLIPTYTVAANGWTVGMRRVFEFNLYTSRDGQVEVKLGGNLIASYGLGTVTRSLFRIELVCLSTGATARFAYGASVYDATTGTATTQVIIGDSQANTDGVGDNWSVDTTASTSITFDYTPTTGSSNPVVHSGSVQIFTP